MSGESLRRRGAIFIDEDRLDEAAASYCASIEVDPDCAEAYFKLGTIYSRTGKLVEAVASYRQAVLLDPGYTKALYNLGNALKRLSCLDEAEEAYRQALHADSEYAPACHNLGVLLQEQGRYAEAEQCFRQALLVTPQDAETLGNLGLSLQSQGKGREAEAYYLAAIQEDPCCAATYNSYGTLRKSEGQFEAAEACYRKALELDPNYPEAMSNLGVVLKDSGLIAEAIHCYRSALQVRELYWGARSNLLLGLLYDTRCTPATYAAEAGEYGRLARKHAEPLQDRCSRPRNPYPLRVGLVSGDLRTHSVGHFIESWLPYMNPARIDLLAYPTHDAADELTHRISPYFSSWKPIHGISDQQAAKVIREDCVDLLLDLSGHTAHNRLPMFSLRPAPVQATWLGYCATTGLAEMDYLIADTVTLPVAIESQFTEKIWRLPKGYLCFTPPAESVEATPPPALERGYIAFGSFNNLSKVNQTVIEVWARILAAVPSSKLILKCAQLSCPSIRRRIEKSFDVFGIHAGRLQLEAVFARRDQHLAAYGQVDIGLDTFPYAGVTTTAEALWMGVPVVSMAGNSFVSRQGAGMLTQVGVPEWIASNADDYVAKAVSLSMDLDQLARTRSGLREKMRDSPLVDAPGFAKGLENALTEMCQSRRQADRAVSNDAGMHVGLSSVVTHNS